MWFQEYPLESYELDIPPKSVTVSGDASDADDQSREIDNPSMPAWTQDGTDQET